MQKESEQSWYTSWFDTPYYAILYKDRDYTEAQSFVNHLLQWLDLSEDAKILDLACGRGRHSVYLNSLGYQVTGADLSSQSIEYAKQFENDKLKFVKHDMCTSLTQKYDAILNLFTSFGYFANLGDNLRTLKAIKEGLKPNGYGVIDFFNVHHVRDHLVPNEVKTLEGITFQISKKCMGNYIHKTIQFTDKGNSYTFVEKVAAFNLLDFKKLFDQANINLKQVFGDYQLNPFDEKKSDRLILIFN